jgi:soluble lytic murein transglycosylase
LSRWAKHESAVWRSLVLGALLPFCGAAQAPNSPAKPPSKAAAKPPSKPPAKTGPKASPHSAHAGTAAAKTASAAARKGSKSKLSTAAGKHHRRIYSKPTPQSIRLAKAFTASAQLRPMAQQLAATRSPAAYAGVLGYAAAHPGEAAAAAYLAIGHAYMLDRRMAEAAAMFRRAATSGTALADYADYLSAQALLQAGRGTEAYPLLDQFAERFPESIFAATAPILLASAHLQSSDSGGALRVLEPLRQAPIAAHADFRYTLGRAYQLSGDTAEAGQVYRRLYVDLPLSNEAAQAGTQLAAMAIPLTSAERKTHADRLFDAKRYAEAGEEYHDIAKISSGLTPADQAALEIYAAVCDLKLKHISRKEIERLPETADDSAALKLYMLAEVSRAEDDRAGHDAIIADMIRRFPTSRWLEEALYSGGNMYLLKHDARQAIYHYTTLVTMFPRSTYGPSAHWRAAWMNYRLRDYSEAARLMDEQIERYGGGIEIPSALYWRGRIFEDEEHNFAQAASYYHCVSETYINSYYGELARQRVEVLGTQPSVPLSPILSAVRKTAVPDLTDALPENDPHLIKARLLANASLNEYIGPEIQASPGSAEWAALAQAEIYASYGEYSRALQSMKHAGWSYFSLPMSDVPEIYWHLLFPKPYWAELVTDAQRNNLDPFLVASLIRQESEFNPGALSHANAYGLMQLLPNVGKAMAKKNGIKKFAANDLLNPDTNLLLGTANLRLVLDRFGGQAEYALAAYNAGDVPVRQWLGSNDYKDVPEFVESIPYTETREYVQAILRNREMYRALYPLN